MNARNRAVLFDLDDTLFDHHHSALSGILALRERRALWRQHTPERLLAEHLRLLEETHLRVLAGDLSAAVARRVRMQGLFAFAGEAVDDWAVEEAIAAYRTAYDAARRAVPGAGALLDAVRARGLAVVVVTNNLAAEQREKLRICRLDGRVDALVTSEEVGAKKPERRIFEVALRRAGCDAARAAMLGDSWPIDVAGARGAGIPSIVWLNRFGLPCPDATWAREVRSLEWTGAVLSSLGIA